MYALYVVIVSKKNVRYNRIFYGKTMDSCEYQLDWYVHYLKTTQWVEVKEIIKGWS